MLCRSRPASMSVFSFMGVTIMSIGDGIRRNIATVSKEERDRFRDAFRKLDDQADPAVVYAGSPVG